MIRVGGWQEQHKLQPVSNNFVENVIKINCFVVSGVASMSIFWNLGNISSLAIFNNLSVRSWSNGTLHLIQNKSQGYQIIDQGSLSE